MIKKLQFSILILLISVTTQAQNWIQIGADIDGESAGDNSGYSVDLNADGSVLAIGAISNNDSFYAAGQVRIYENLSGTWVQIGEDINGTASDDGFGYSVSLSSDGTVVAIGAPYNDDIAVNSGQVRIYENIEGTWTQIGEAIGGEAIYDQSGKSISLSSDGTIITIGARYNDGNGEDSGHVRIYENQSGTWTQVGADIDGEFAEDYFGISVSINGDGSIVAVGAMGSDTNGEDSGHVRIYKNILGTWTQIGSSILGEASFDMSGTTISLSLDGAVVAIGSYWNDGAGFSAGHVRIYKNESDEWLQVGEDIDGEAEGDWSGYSVCLNSNGSVVAIGAVRNQASGEYAGHVRTYQNQSDTWIQIGEDIDAEAAGDMFGVSVSLNFDGDVLAIGASANDGNGSAAGHVQVYGNEYLGVESLAQKGVSIYPNPTNGEIYFEFENNKIQQITVSDTNGKQIIKKSILKQTEMIDLSRFENGVYIINIQTEDEILLTKIVKE